MSLLHGTDHKLYMIYSCLYWGINVSPLEWKNNMYLFLHGIPRVQDSIWQVVGAQHVSVEQMEKKKEMFFGESLVGRLFCTKSWLKRSNHSRRYPSTKSRNPKQHSFQEELVNFSAQIAYTSSDKVRFLLGTCFGETRFVLCCSL